MNGLWMRELRDAAPWMLVGILAWVFASLLIPDSRCRTSEIRAEIARLDREAPQPEALRERLGQAVADSIDRAAMRRVAAARQASGSDPSSLVAATVVPRLESHGVRLLRVSAREEGREVLLSLSVQTTWRELLTGFDALDSLPLAWHTRRLVLKPADGFRLVGDLVIGVPTTPREFR